MGIAALFRAFGKQIVTIATAVKNFGVGRLLTFLFLAYVSLPALFAGYQNFDKGWTIASIETLKVIGTRVSEPDFSMYENIKSIRTEQLTLTETLKKKINLWGGITGMMCLFIVGFAVVRAVLNDQSAAGLGTFILVVVIVILCEYAATDYAPFIGLFDKDYGLIRNNNLELLMPLNTIRDLYQQFTGRYIPFTPEDIFNKSSLNVST